MIPRQPGTGIVKQVLSADPAAGAEVSIAVPAGKEWRLISGRVPLVTSATAANRRPHIVMDDGTASVHMRSPAGAVQAASLTVGYNCGPGIPQDAAAVDGEIRMTLPACEVYLAAGHRLRTITTALQAGDNYGAVALLVEEWGG